MNKLKAGIVGCGGIANQKHLPSIKALGEVDVVAFCDIKPERAEKTAKEYGTADAKCYTDYKELLKDPSLGLDMVYVCTPNRSHCEIAVAALEAGNHVLCEKPMAINSAQAKLMVEAAKKTGKLLTIGYQNRQRPDSQYLKAEAMKDTFGDIYYAKATSLRRRGVPTWGVFTNEFEQGGGPLIDIGTHALDLTLWIMNYYKPAYVVGTIYHKLNDQVESANVFGNWDVNDFTVEDSAFGYIVMENGATIVLESSWALNILDQSEAVTTICGTKAGADMNDGLRINGIANNTMYTLTPKLAAEGVAYFDGIAETPAIREQRVFVNAVKGKGELVVLPEQALVVTQILEAIYESAKTGKPVYFNK